MTVYDGTQTTADPTIESVEGVGNVPAYMGLAYVVFDGMQLKDYGDRAPELMFEVYTSGDDSTLHVDQFSNEVLYPWLVGNADPVDLRNDNTFSTVGGGGGSTATFDAYMAAHLPTWPVHVYGWRSGSNVNTTIYPTEGAGTSEAVTLCIDVNCAVLTDVGVLNWNGLFDPPGGPVLLGTSLGEQTLVWWCGNPATSGFTHQESGIWWYASTGTNADFFAAYATLPDPPASTAYGGPSAPYYYRGPDVPINVTRAPTAPPNVEDGWIAIPDAPGSYVDQYGDVHTAHNWVVDSSVTYKVLQKYAHAGGAVTKYPLSPARPSYHSQYSDAVFWTAAYDAAVLTGDLPGGLTYGVDYPVTQSFGYKDVAAGEVVEVFPVPVDNIVSLICQRSGLTTGEIERPDTT